MHTIRLNILIFFVLVISCGFININTAFSDDSNSAQPPANSAKGKEPAVQLKNDKTGNNAHQMSSNSMSPHWRGSNIDTTASADYLTEAERQIIIEINMVRTDPSEYARRYLVPLQAYYHDKLLQFPGEVAISTNEGIHALDECIKELQAAKPLVPLFPPKGLTLAARDHAEDQAKNGTTGHTGSDRSTMETRLNRYGKWDISAGENISYGNVEAKRIVTSLLIDDGVPSRGHRKNLLNGTFKFVGVSVGPHQIYKHICVMNFAGSYQ